jgi:ELWxxDGT repeat protein
LKKSLLLVIIITTALHSGGQVQQVADIYPGSRTSFPGFLTPFGGRLIFLADDSLHGRELWTYSGFGAASMVADLVPGTDGIGAPYLTTREHFAEMNGKLYFMGGYTNDEGELYEWDGSSSPKLVADINPGSISSVPSGFIVLGNVLYFAARSAANGRELYSYTGVGAPVLHDVNPGPADSNPEELVAYNGRLYFSAQSGVVGYELFEYDPSSNTTRLVSDIEAGSNSSGPMMFQEIGSKLLFRASTQAKGVELYSYDGVSTNRLTDISQNGGDGVDNIVGEWNGKLYFQGGANYLDRQLYCYDPATGNATVAATINAGANSQISTGITYQGKLYFSAKLNATDGRELCVYDGSDVTMVANINPAPGWDGGGLNLTVCNGILYFVASDGAHGGEVWRLGNGGGTGIEKVSLPGSVRLYPNPVFDYLTLQIDLKEAYWLNLTIIDVAGRVIAEISSKEYNKGKTEIHMSTTQWLPGLYYYRLVGKDGHNSATGSFFVN